MTVLDTAPVQAMEGSRFRDLVLELAQPSKVLSRDELRTASKVSMMVWDFLQFKAQRLVRLADNSPVLYSYGADGTMLLSNSCGEMVCRICAASSCGEMCGETFGEILG